VSYVHGFSYSGPEYFPLPSRISERLLFVLLSQ
jgi:hypothetical protein